MFFEEKGINPVTNPMTMQCGKQAIYVSPDGNDWDDGSLEHPFQTVARATAMAQNILMHNPCERISIFFRNGTYSIDEPIEWTTENSPGEAGSVTYCAYQEEPVIFSGAISFGQLHWETYRGDIKVADIEKECDFDVLYANAERQIMARYPNYTTPDTIFGYSGDAADVLSADRIQHTWKNAPTDGYVRALHEREWGGNSYKITDVDENGKVSLQWVGDNNRGAGYKTNQMVVENVLEELDAPNEWYYDKRKGKLYFYPPLGMDLSEAVFEGAAASELFRLTGDTPDRPIQNIKFTGIHFTKTHRTLFNSVYERPLRGDWGLARTGALFMENAKNVIVTNCRFDEIGGNAIMMSGYNEKHSIDSNRMTKIGASAVLIVGREDAVRDPSHWDNDDHKTVINDTSAGPKSENYPRDITISNTYMYDLGIYEKQVSGICISIAARIHVKGNTIHRCPRAGINISDGTFGGHLIEDNDIFDCVRGTSDHGPINAWGRDRFWSLGGYDTRGSKGAEKKPYAFLDVIERNVIRHNRISHTSEFGVDLDDGSSNYEIYDNLFLGTGVKLREGFGRTVRNNIIVNGSINIHVSYEGNDDVVQNNVIIAKTPYKFISPNSGSKTNFNRNLLYFGEQTVDVQAYGESKDTDYITGAPLFTNPDAHDYTLKAPSPALKQGFHNFDMNSFGVKGAPVPPVQKLNFAVEDGSDEENFLGGRISSIYSEGILSATGMSDYKGGYVIKPFSVEYLEEEQLETNDVILTLNGAKIQNKMDFLIKYGNIVNGTSVLVTVFRNQKKYGKTIMWVKQD